MITLRSDNRILTINSKYSYLVDNYASGSSSIYITNTDGFSDDDFILINEFGQENAEIFRCGTIVPGTGEIPLLDSNGAPTTTSFAHSESSKVYIIPYNKIRFYWTASTGTIADENPTFDTDNPISGYIELEPSSEFTMFDDNTNPTGFGWFVYQNSITSDESEESNPIPYTGFDYNTVANIFSDFDSLLNVNELKLVSMSDKLSWLNEALSLIKNKLNLTNTEYTVSTEQTINVTSGTAEYLLPADFADLVYIRDDTSEKNPIPFMKISSAQTNTGTETSYYLRGRYIGFTPAPTTDMTVKYGYRANATRVTSLSTYIDLPDNAFYSIKDFMMYRASLKFKNPEASTYYQSFINSVNLSIQSAVKRDANLDSWDIVSNANE